MAVRGPAAHLRRAPSWRRSGDETYWDDLRSKVEADPPTSRIPRAPRPQSAVEGGLVDGWLQQPEGIHTGHFKGSAHDQEPPFNDRTMFVPSLPNKPAGSSLPYQGLSPPACGVDLSSCETPSLWGSSLAGSQESLTSGQLHAPGRRGSWERAHIKQAPGTELAKLASLAPVRIGWLPIERKIMVADVPSQIHHPETSASQVKLKQPITPAFLKNPGKVNGFRYMEGEGKKSQFSPGALSVRTWSSPEQASPSIQQVPANGGSATGESDRLIGWHGLRRGWNINRASPQSGGTQPDDSQAGTGPECYRKTPLCRTASHEPFRTTAPAHGLVSTVRPSHTETTSAGTALAPKSQGSFSSITIISRKVTRTASLPRSGHSSSPGDRAGGQGPPPNSSSSSSARLTTDAYPPGPVTLGRKATVVKVTEHRMTSASPVSCLNGPRGDGATASADLPRDRGCETVVRRRKATIVKVTEHRESYRPGDRRPEYRHSYSEGVYRENSLWQQGSLDPPEHAERSPGRGNPALASSTPSAAALRTPEDARPLHRSTLRLFVNGPSTEEPSFRNVAGERSERRGRPLSCYADVTRGLGEPAHETAAAGAVRAAPGRRGGAELPRGTDLPRVTDFKPAEDAAAAGGAPARSAVGAGTPSEDTGPPAADAPPRLVADEAERAARQQGAGGRSHPPNITLIQTPDRPQLSPENTLALNAAAIIANIKLQRRLSKTTRLNGISANAASQGNTLERDADEFEKPEMENNMVRQDFGGTPSPATPLNQPHVGLAPPRTPALENSTVKGLSLREALEQCRPDFISRSRSRQRELERRAQERRELQGSSDPQPEATLRHKRGHCTRPSPQSDNLFRPRDRAITGREMQQRSKRNYSNLPEVQRKAEEEKRRVVSQTNRQRVELFKKKLLDQVLKRAND